MASPILVNQSPAIKMNCIPLSTNAAKMDSSRIAKTVTKIALAIIAAASIALSFLIPPVIIAAPLAFLAYKCIARKYFEKMNPVKEALKSFLNSKQLLQIHSNGLITDAFSTKKDSYLLKINLESFNTPNLETISSFVDHNDHRVPSLFYADNIQRPSQATVCFGSRIIDMKKKDESVAVIEAARSFVDSQYQWLTDIEKAHLVNTLLYNISQRQINLISLAYAPLASKLVEFTNGNQSLENKAYAEFRFSKITDGINIELTCHLEINSDSKPFGKLSGKFNVKILPVTTGENPQFRQIETHTSGIELKLC